MGATGLKTLRYAGNGTGFTFGQAYTAGGVWPKITVHSMTRTIDYDGGAMRDQVVMSRAEPLGGGGYAMSGQQRNDQFLNGEVAWNQTGTTVAPGSRVVTDRVHQLWIILIEADTFTPGEPNAPPPATPNPNHLNLIANIERLGLPVDRIAPLHGRVVPIVELYTAAGKISPR